LDNVPVQVKTLAQYKAELKAAQHTLTEAQAKLQKLQADELKKLEQLRKKISTAGKRCKG